MPKSSLSSNFASIFYLVFPIFLLVIPCNPQCNPCFYSEKTIQCPDSTQNDKSLTLYFSVHAHLDAYKDYNFETYYLIKGNSEKGEEETEDFQKKNMSEVKEIYDTVLEILAKSWEFGVKTQMRTQQGRRNFFSSEIGFFRYWYLQLNNEKKKLIKNLVKDAYWQFLGGGIVQHDQACSYYQDIIQNYEQGLGFLQKEFNYIPKTAYSSTPLSHSSSSIFSHLGMEAVYLEHSSSYLVSNPLLLSSHSNSVLYSKMPIYLIPPHTYQPFFVYYPESDQPFCQILEPFLQKIRQQNNQIKKYSQKSGNWQKMTIFGGKFQKFDMYQYDVLEGFMEQFVRERCENVIAMYGLPSQFVRIMFENKMEITERNKDFIPGWDYQNGVYRTGYYTTDPYHKKIFRDSGRFLYAVRKAILPYCINHNSSTLTTKILKTLQKYSETVALLQHHHGISGTAKYQILDQYQNKILSQASKITKQILPIMFQQQYSMYTSNYVLTCGIFQQCMIPEKMGGDLVLKVFNSGTRRFRQPIVIHLPENQFYEPRDQKYQILCMCHSLPCTCQLYIFKQLNTFSQILLKKVESSKNIYFLKKISPSNSTLLYNETHITVQSPKFQISYKKISSKKNVKQFQYINKYGQKTIKNIHIQSSKQILANSIENIQETSKIRNAFFVEGQNMQKYLVLWEKVGMKSVISRQKGEGKWTVQTYHAPTSGNWDYYIEIAAGIENNVKFYTDSNGWLNVQRQIFNHQKYMTNFPEDGSNNINGNTFPITSFAYIEDKNLRLSVNTDRPQGVVCIKQGKIWLNFDRITLSTNHEFQSAFRSEYKKFTHFISLQQNKPQSFHSSHRISQQQYDQPLLFQFNLVQPCQRFSLKKQYKIFSQSENQSQNRNVIQKLIQISGMQNTKFWVRVRDDFSVILRVRNINEDRNITIGLYRDNISLFLSAYYQKSIYFQHIQQVSLSSNTPYSKFLQNKWNLFPQPQIFSLKFSQNIVLQPLQIRSFKLTNLTISKLDSSILNVLQSTPEQKGKDYRFDQKKPAPKKDRVLDVIQNNIKNFLHFGDHCQDQDVPILFKKTIEEQPIYFHQVENILSLKDILILPSKYFPLPEPGPLNIFPTSSVTLIQHELEVASFYNPSFYGIPDAKLHQLEQKIKKMKPISINEKKEYFKQKVRVIKKKLQK